MRGSERPSETNFWSGVLTVFGSQLAVKLLGLIYRLVIANIDGFGDVDNGYYNAGFQIYTLLPALSSVGIPSAISRLVAQAEAAGANFATSIAFTFAGGIPGQSGVPDAQALSQETVRLIGMLAKGDSI